MLKEEVDAEDIAEVVGKATGVPVTRLLESETSKLVHLEALLHQRVIDYGQVRHVGRITHLRAPVFLKSSFGAGRGTPHPRRGKSYRQMTLRPSRNRQARRVGP
jgi:hypothetical protein